jgi:hypothetical protein
VNQRALTTMQAAKLRQAVPMDVPQGSGDIADIINSLYSLGGNSITHTFSGTPNSNEAITHNLGYVPTGFLVTSQSNAGVIYSGSSAWTATSIFLSSTVASTVATIIVF